MTENANRLNLTKQLICNIMHKTAIVTKNWSFKFLHKTAFTVAQWIEKFQRKMAMLSHIDPFLSIAQLENDN